MVANHIHFYPALLSHFPDERASVPGPQPGPPVRLGFPIWPSLGFDATSGHHCRYRNGSCAIAARALAVYADRDRQAQRYRSARLACRRARPPARSSGQTDRRTSALEFETAQHCSRSRLTRFLTRLRSSPGACGAAVGGREMHVENLNGGELVEHGPGSEAGGQRPLWRCAVYGERGVTPVQVPRS
jgi:hypothetical protein